MTHLSRTVLAGALCLALAGCAQTSALWPRPSSSETSATSVEGAEDLIRSLFGSSDWAGTSGSRAARLAWMTPELAEASLRLDALTDNVGVGIEPSVGSRYIYVTDARYSARATPWGAEVQVRFLNTNEPRETRFEMVRTDAGWRVADIVGRDPATGRTWRYTDQMAEVFAAVARGEGPRDPS